MINTSDKGQGEKGLKICLVKEEGAKRRTGHGCPILEKLYMEIRKNRR